MMKTQAFTSVYCVALLISLSFRVSQANYENPGMSPCRQCLADVGSCGEDNQCECLLGYAECQRNYDCTDSLMPRNIDDIARDQCGDAEHGGGDGGDMNGPAECVRCIESANECANEAHPYHLGCDCVNALKACKESYDCMDVLPQEYMDHVTDTCDDDNRGMSPCQACLAEVGSCDDDNQCECLRGYVECHDNYDCSDVPELPRNIDDIVRDQCDGSGDGSGDGPAGCLHCIESANECPEGGDPYDLECDCVNALKSCKESYDCTGILSQEYLDYVMDEDCEPATNDDDQESERDNDSGGSDGDTGEDSGDDGSEDETEDGEDSNEGSDGDDDDASGGSSNQGDSEDSGSSGVSTGAGIGIGVAGVFAGSALILAGYKFSRKNANHQNNAVGETVNPIAVNSETPPTSRAAVVSNVYATESPA